MIVDYGSLSGRKKSSFRTSTNQPNSHAVFFRIRMTFL